MNGYQNDYQTQDNCWNHGIQSYPTQTIGTAVATGPYTTQQFQQFQQAFQNQEKAPMSGNKPIVVCGSEQKEAKDMDDAQAIAESLAHKSGADAYILKPVKKVSPKRDVVTTDL